VILQKSGNSFEKKKLARKHGVLNNSINEAAKIKNGGKEGSRKVNMRDKGQNFQGRSGNTF